MADAAPRGAAPLPLTMAPTRGRPPAADEDGSLVALHRARFVDWAPAPVVALAPAPDGAALAAARDDGALELWDVDSWACLVVSVGRGGQAAPAALAAPPHWAAGRRPASLPVRR